jgi:hypothetical protein
VFRAAETCGVAGATAFSTTLGVETALFFLGAGGAFSATGVGAGADARAGELAGFAFVVFFAALPGGLLAAFFLTAFFAAGAFFAAFLTDFFAFFTVRFAVLARLFEADALAALPRDDLRAFFAPRFLTVFLALATTMSFIARTRLSGIFDGGASTALLPQASRTPRKPEVFAPDYILRCRARRG